MAMASKKDYYEVLGVNKDASQSDIKKAYRKMAKKYHPDTNAGNAQAEAKFKEVSEAYSVLSDPKQKKLYDQFGHAAFDGSASGPQGRSEGGNYREYHFEGGDMDDILKNIFGGGFSGGFSNGFSSGFRTEDFKQNGADVKAEINVTFDEAAFGCDKFIRISDASGKNFESVKVHIPAGIDDGKSIRLKGRGKPGVNGGKNGDLLIKVNVMKKQGFERKGMDVYSTVKIPFTTAVLGGKTAVQTLHGKVMCKIAPGTQSGTKLRIKDKGIVSMKDPSQYGSHYACVEIKVPQNISVEAKQKLREFGRLCGEEDLPS